MKSMISLLVVISLFLLSGSPVFASSCENVLRHINSDIQSHSPVYDAGKLPWQKLSGLLRIMGEPRMHFEHQTQFSWTCPSNPASYLKATVDPGGNLIHIEGQFSSETGAGIFSENFVPTREQLLAPPMPQTPTTMPQTPTTMSAAPVAMPAAKVEHHHEHPEVAARPAPDDENAALKLAARDYRKWFNMKVPENKLKIVSLKMLDDYYQKLKQCLPGHYKYPRINNYYGQRLSDDKVQPMLMLGVATIEGMKNGKCIVILGHKTSPEAAKCEFTTDNLNLLAGLKVGSGQLQAVDKQRVDQLMDEACQREK